MSSLQDQLAAAKAKLEGTTASGAEATGVGTGTAGAPSVADPDGFDAGAEDTATNAPAENAAPLTQPAGTTTYTPGLDNAAPLAGGYVPKQGDYKAIKLTALIDAKGKRTKPNAAGYYTDLTPEQVTAMQYFVDIGAVEKVGG